MDQRSKEWLKAEADRWAVDGIITEEQCEQIKLQYPISKASSPLLTFFAVIGSLLIGAGIILVFATNWWTLPVELRVALAFVPLLLAQAICLYTYKRKYHSTSFREGSAVFLSLSFFAALALIGQTFHTPSDLSSYILVCILFSLPAVYLFRAKSVMTIYVIGSMFVAGDLSPWTFLVLTVLTLPFFYLEVVGNPRRRGLNYLLLLLSLMVSRTVITTVNMEMSLLEIALLCGLAMLLVDALFRKISSAYFFTSAKLLAITCITITLTVSMLDMTYSDSPSVAGLALTAAIAVLYIVLRGSTFTGVAASELFFAAAVVLILSADFAGVAACILAVALGVYYIVRGSRALVLSHINYGMALVVIVIAIRFFDYSLGLLARGLVFILLGAAFLGINLYISHKRKGLQQ